jgi:ketosteroid isomerase-like protein
VASKAGGTPQQDGGKYALVLKSGSDGLWKIHHDMDNSDSMPTPSRPAEPSR